MSDDMITNMNNTELGSSAQQALRESANRNAKDLDAEKQKYINDMNSRRISEEKAEEVFTYSVHALTYKKQQENK